MVRLWKNLTRYWLRILGLNPVSPSARDMVWGKLFQHFESLFPHQQNPGTYCLPLTKFQ